MARIKVAITKSLEKVYKLRNGMTIGRDPKNSIQLLAQPVSRNHAQFVVEGDTVSIMDLGSSNGTKVNGERISQVELKEGDKVVIGGVIMTFEREVAHVADENIFVLDDTKMPEERIKQIAGRSELGLMLASDPSLVDLAYNVGRKYLEGVGLQEDDNVNVLTALYEAMDNAKRHGNEGNPAKQIRLYFIDSPEKLSVSVVDEGKGFDYASILQKTEEQDALSAARERYMAGGLGGLGIRLMLKCVDKVAYEEEGAKIVLTKFKQPLEPEEVEDKELTTAEEVYKNTLWDEIQKTGEKVPERQGKLAQRMAQEQAQAESAPESDEFSAARPEERVKRFEDRLSQFFMHDGREGLKAASDEDMERQLSEPKSQKEQELEPDSSELQINMPEHIQTDESQPPDKDDMDLDL